MAQDLEVKVSPLGGLQGQVLNKEAGRAMALLVSATSEPLGLSQPRQLVYNEARGQVHFTCLFSFLLVRSLGSQLQLWLPSFCHWTALYRAGGDHPPPPQTAS